ncbi:VOC family protein [Angustibacter luteus]|uniref:VOC family protein n=1 Tax=Angustibacter luteus TaxID=658456 RepID=A0ABW1JG34_9ACTN
MEPQVSFLTFATADLDAARAFYVAGLGWAPLLDVPGEIVFFQVAPGQVLGFFDAEKFAADAGGAVPPAVSGVTLSHNLGSRADVDSTVALLESVGGAVVRPPSESAFGGIYNAHVRDPNGVVWEIAHNRSWSVAADGTVSLG